MLALYLFSRFTHVMDNTSTIYLVAATGGTIVLASYLCLIAIPAWRSYSRISQRLSALVLTLYILFVLLLVGTAVGAAVLWSWDQL